MSTSNWFVQLRENVIRLRGRVAGVTTTYLTVVANSLTITNGVSIKSGAATPEAAVTAPVGSLYLRTDGSTSTTLYVKTSGAGNTGWTAK